MKLEKHTIRPIDVLVAMDLRDDHLAGITHIWTACPACNDNHPKETPRDLES